LAQNAAHAGGLSFARDGVLEVIHVRIGGDAAADHLQCRQARAPSDELLGDVARFGGEDVLLEPVLKRQIIGNAPEENHGGVAVRVDQAGQDQLAAGQNAPCRRVPCRNLDTRANRQDLVAADCNGAILKDAEAGVHRHDGAAGDQQVHLLLLQSLWPSRRLRRCGHGPSTRDQ